MFDSDELSVSYTSAGTISFRVVPSGLGTDSPLVWFSGSGVATPVWLHTDNQGSIVAQSSATGAASPATPYGYDPYGVPDTTNGFGGPPLKYTGQMSLPSVSLYDYKARDYDPNLGRFLQTDPSGSAGGINLYSYANDGPLNGVDPFGLTSLDQILTDGGGPPEWDPQEPGGFAELGGADGGGGGSGGSRQVCNDYNTDGGGLTLIVQPCQWESDGFGGGTEIDDGLNGGGGGGGGNSGPVQTAICSMTASQAEHALHQVQAHDLAEAAKDFAADLNPFSAYSNLFMSIFRPKTRAAAVGGVIQDQIAGKNEKLVAATLAVELPEKAAGGAAYFGGLPNSLLMALLKNSSAAAEELEQQIYAQKLNTPNPSCPVHP